MDGVNSQQTVFKNLLKAQSAKLSSKVKKFVLSLFDDSKKMLKYVVEKEAKMKCQEDNEPTPKDQ